MLSHFEIEALWQKSDCDPDIFGKLVAIHTAIDTLRLYAHWKDGVQYVGSCGKTLADAIANIRIQYD